MKWLAKAFLRLMGWAPEGARPDAPKYVLIAAPHTTNWDFPLTIALASIFDVKIRWMGKHTLFRWPYGWLMRRLGGIPIRRDRRGNLVEAMAADFANYQELVVTVPAEGTRRRVEYWKSGFYQIAAAANVPIVLGYLDYRRKRGGFGPAILPTGSLREDMDLIRAFYADKIGKYPENFGPVRLRDETLSQDSASAQPAAADAARR